MKNSLFLIAFLSLVNFSFGQTPDRLNYQAVIRNSSGQILTGADISLRFTIFQNGAPVFNETDQVHTTDYGIANTFIGDSGAGFSDINWGSGGIQYLTELSTNGQDFEPVGSMQEFSFVAFAEFSKTSAAVEGMDALFVGAMPVFGSFEGQAVIEGSDWQQVTRTTYEPFENFFAQTPVKTGMAREYYLLIDYADNVAASTNAATNWRFWMDWTPAPGHQFSLPSVWGDLGAGRPVLVKVPTIVDQVNGDSVWQHKYWRLEARVSGQFPAASARVKSIQVVAYDVRNGQTASVDLNADFPGGKPGVYLVGGLNGSLRVSDNGQWNRFASPLEIDLSGGTGPSGRDALWLTGSGDNDAVVIVSNKPKVAFWDRNAQNASGIVCRSVITSQIGVGTDTPQATLDVNGDLRTKCISITGGCDLYERSKAAEEIEAGELVVSDGRSGFNFVKRADKKHDRKVVGVVSGGGGVSPGIELVMPGVLDGNVKIAIAGRVMVKTTGKVEEGDMLTTSDVPGRAMAVKNFKKAMGAIVGKALTGPDENGFVLMLINLQ